MMTLFLEGFQTYTENPHKWRTQWTVMKTVSHRGKLWECVVVCILFLEVRGYLSNEEDNDEVF
jgi:hypothetical protein